VTDFVLRAHKIVVPPIVIYAVTLWGVGVFGGYQLAFRGVAGPPWGIAGMWLMQSIALALAAALLVGFYLWVIQRVAKTAVRPLRSNVST
jgi:MATE family multidrug resistance protein